MEDFVIYRRNGGCCSLCHLGASHLSILSVFSGFLVLQAVATRIHLGLCHFATTYLHEGHKASEISQEEEAKDASSAIYVKTKPYEKFATFFLLLVDKDDTYAHVATGRLPGYRGLSKDASARQFQGLGFRTV
ncbi:unnamed protein product [Arabis nemorensis]|uniref:Uncharacterized protein n=1 Tax=Arabis nemorensis TaxID=586526 RepID=A0A565ARF3_9BRAS|nr:unnamed protein product [Arabis nemorensis]